MEVEPPIGLERFLGFPGISLCGGWPAIDLEPEGGLLLGEGLFRGGCELIDAFSGVS